MTLKAVLLAAAPLALGMASSVLPSSAAAQTPDREIAALAEAFAAPPHTAGARLSPDGRRISYIQYDSAYGNVAGIFDLDTGRATGVLRGDGDPFRIDWCEWVNETRLLCGFRGVVERRGYDPYTTTRLVAVDADGTDVIELLQRRLGRYQDRVIDGLPDDPERVLIRVPSGLGYAIGQLNVYDGSLSHVGTEQSDTLAWITDWRGDLRLYARSRPNLLEWHARAAGGATWKLLREQQMDDWSDKFSPIGFGEDIDTLLYFDSSGDRVGVYSIGLADDEAEPHLVFAHPEVDVEGAYRFGTPGRYVAALYNEERPRLSFFDKRAEEIHALLSQQLGDRFVYVVSEDRNQRNYLAFAYSDTDSGSYWHFDTEDSVLTRLAEVHPALRGHTLLPMQHVHYTARDGTAIPAYLTAPESSALLPAVLMPHGGPERRDYWGYDFLAQFLAANGYAVLQPNFRGSSGYGEEWIGRGGFRDWRQAVDDIVDGARYLTDRKRVEPDRICAVGWSYGGTVPTP